MTDSTVAPGSQVPLGWFGGRWFMAKDYIPHNDTVVAVKSFIAGGAAGASSKTVVAPLERVKILIQIENMRASEQFRPSRTIPSIAKDVLFQEGFRSFWKGNGTNVVRIIPNKGILFMC